MKYIILIVFVLLSNTVTKAQDIEPWTEYMTPSTVQEFFATYTGSFTLEMSMWMGGALEPTIVTVNSEHEMILGNRYLEMRQQGSMMGMDYQSIFTLGHNNSDESITLVILTNMGTGILSLQGDWDDSTRSATIFGALTNPVTKKSIQIKQIASFLDEDTFLIVNYDLQSDGKEVKTVQYKFTRVDR
jgi:hypothetical protein